MNLFLKLKKSCGVLYKVFIAVLIVGICGGNTEYVLADEMEVVDVELRLSDLLQETMEMEGTSNNNNSTDTVWVRYTLLDPNTNQPIVTIEINFTYTYSDGNSVVINSVNAANITSHGYYEAAWNGSGEITNDLRDARYIRQFITHNTVTDGRMIYKYTLIVDIYGELDENIVFLGGY